MERLPKRVDFLEVERKWERLWEEWGIYRFDWEDETRPVYVIDTPPPYPSGDFHMGNVLNWTYIDIAARYKRMRGYNVLFPQGWDCHGLPTEVATEKAHNIRRSDVPPDEFRRLCEEWVSQYIDIMKQAIIRLGCSVDWSTEYRTMDPRYWRKTQLSFILLYRKGLIYRGEHPINWCPRCETAIADAEVEHRTKKGRLAYIRFGLREGHLLIATTRPEYIPACVAVAVHPEDERYRDLIGEKAVTPLFHREVEIVADEEVDPSFGTGAMMICTYGDKADVSAVARLNLPVIKLVDERGRVTEAGGRYAGMTVEEAREAILEDLGEEGLLERVEEIDQDVGVCWRCKTPIEILVKEQWFMRTKALTEEVVKTALEIKWFPDYMKYRLIDWAKSLDWDWVISRQRVFATPIPVWYCADCGEIIVADPEELPVDPKTTPPRVGRCPKCGGRRFIPERDVLDTWFDSSLSCAHHAGWPDRPDWRRFYPNDLHPSGHDIIRTWAYYLMVRSLALFGETPYKAVLINGMVLGSDGRKMSKSLGNYVPTPEVFSRYGADAARQWAAGGGSTGSDIPFRWEDVEYGRRFMRKLWNACRFASIQLEDFNPEEGGGELMVLDRWLLSRLERLTEEVTEALEGYQFSTALNAIRNFTWHTLCDHYIEAVKHRLYRGEKGRSAAQSTLYQAIYRVLQLLAPFCPHITEEIYQRMFSRGPRDSIHLTRWPEADRSRVDEAAERMGDVIVAVIREVRREKNRRGLPLNAELGRLTIYAGDASTKRALEAGIEDLAATVKASEVEVLPVKGEGVAVEGYPDISFTFTDTGGT
ncbi:valine--tRNA ligase [Candidatus Bathyarchaeota archaeon]|nr:MAG: valine--tRNA ligase [Candidatus Bathyarchaeota archaeon]